MPIKKPNKQRLLPIDNDPDCDTMSYPDRYLPNQTTFPFFDEDSDDNKKEKIKEEHNKNEM